jgi:hypothetical protein
LNKVDAICAAAPKNIGQTLFPLRNQPRGLALERRLIVLIVLPQGSTAFRGWSPTSTLRASA